jgi:hypothetical protein
MQDIIFPALITDNNIVEIFTADPQLSSNNKPVIRAAKMQRGVFDALREFLSSPQATDLHTNFAIKVAQSNIEVYRKEETSNSFTVTLRQLEFDVVPDPYKWKLEDPEILNVTINGVPSKYQSSRGEYKRLGFYNPFQKRAYGYQEFPRTGIIKVKDKEYNNVEQYSASITPYLLGLPNQEGIEKTRMSRASKLIKLLEEAAKFRDESFNSGKILQKLGEYTPKQTKPTINW